MAKIYVWDLKLQKPDLRAPSTAEKVTSAIRNIGHSSILCDQMPLKTTPTGIDTRYISYWPDRGVGLKASSSEGYATPTYQDDISAEGGDPDKVFDLTCLDDAAMVQWWQAFIERRAFIGPYSLEYWPQDNHYDLWRTNCSTMAALAMKIGGSDRYSRTPASTVNTPSEVASFARDIAFNAKVTRFVKGVGQKLFGP